LTNRITLLTILILSFLYSMNISSIKVPLTYDIVGPKSFPLFVAGILITSSAVLLLMQSRARPDADDIHTAFRTAGILLFYIITFKLLGFMLSTVISVFMLSKSLKISWIRSLLTGLLLAITIYGFLHFYLGMPLPMGLIYRTGSL